MRLVFLGTSDFSLKSLKALIASKHEVLAVVTKEDKIGNRNKVFEPPVKTLAAQNGILVYQFKSIRKQGVDVLKAINPDIIVTCSFGQILSQEILDIPKFGVINVHASLLPKYRGASPIQQSILNGDRFTGVTIMQTEYAIDSGDVLLAEHTEIGEKETAGELFSRLADLGAKALLTALSQIENGTATYTPQNHSEATFCGTLKKEDGLIDFSSTAERLDCFVRGLTPWPSAYTYIAGKKFKIFEKTTRH
jgi:methionyl-tRNA formyltransferase